MKKTRNQCGLLLENAHGEILLQLRDNKPTIPFPNCWGTFGGQVEAGETPAAAIVREIREELQYELQQPQQYAIYRYDGYDIYMFQKIDTSISIDMLTVSEGQRGKFWAHENLVRLDFAFNCKEIVDDYFSRYKK